MDKNNIVKKLTAIETLLKEIYLEITEDDSQGRTNTVEETKKQNTEEKQNQKPTTPKTNDNIFKM